MKSLFGENLRYDLKASLVVFLVALPLCLGIAIASGAPPISGLIAGIVGGIVIGSFSKSHVSVSGPAAGLTVIVLDSISSLGTFELFLGALVVAGLIQFSLGLAKAGILGYYFPHSVIKGMLTAIGLILILKQIPHALGYDKDYLGDLAFKQMDDQNTFTEIYNAFLYNNPGAIPVVLVALGILIFFERPRIKSHRILGVVPGALWAVVSGIVINALYSKIKPEWELVDEHLVTIPDLDSFSELPSLLTFPDFGLIADPAFWIVAVTLAVIGSIETLLSIEAGDKMDPYKRITPASKELVAQGVGNTLSGLIGGLPITAVIVRTSANIASGARTKLSAIFHGILLMVLVLSIPELLNQIPLSCLAAVLFLVGYKLAKPSIFVHEYEKGINQFLPFIFTVIAILFTDLLVGIGIGMIVGLFFVIKTNFQKAILVTELNGNYLVKLQKDVSFLNKAPLMRELAQIPPGSNVILNGSKARFIDHDIQEVLNDFISSAHTKDISITIEGYSYHLREAL
ncbi:MFS superfamily sulfate permease-like transporter [Algoriphagus aquaeductus]|uniref:MFS superfamily sulfate permease-like transporter n=1 Tax=Algoriphagus aquaeductus TaxID=475299 RepID=A0A326RRW4_9BACT|nr:MULTISPECIES: SulP family inorganic anion transporter [Algoriphagus]PZV83223.1 MFS superfamily sulfate permease-like transporter [Algoriphagus aquaeductus]